MIEVTEWESDRVRLVQLVGVPVGRRFPVPRRGRPIDSIYIHSGSPAAVGIAAVEELAEFWVSPAVWAGGKWLGGGRDQDCPGFHIVVPSEPTMTDGRLVAYRVVASDIPTDQGLEEKSIRVWLAGDYASRHRASDPLTSPRPSHAAVAALTEVVRYLRDVHSISVRNVRGGFDSGTPADPGDWVEQWVRHQRGESVSPPDEAGQLGTLVEHRPIPMAIQDRQRALKSLGYMVPTAEIDRATWGLWSREALRAFQSSAGIISDGVWGLASETALRAATAPKKGRR